MIHLVPDFYTWVTTVEFAITTEELLTFLQQTSDEVFHRILNSEDAFLFTANQTSLGLTASRCRELELASKELQQDYLTSEPELAASLAFVLGRWTKDQAQAREYYENSLNLYPETGNPVKKGLIYLHLGLWWRSYAVQQRQESQAACQRAKDYFQQAIAFFQQAERGDLVSKYINYQAEVLHRLAQGQDKEPTPNPSKEGDRRQNPSKEGNRRQKVEGKKEGYKVEGNDKARHDIKPKLYTPNADAITQGMQLWQELEQICHQALPLHQTQGDLFRQARTYGFLAEVALAKADPTTAQQ
ncbi:MAG: hypothetical protein F6K47_42210, partial [Symploca sp. SIO2E6]|nr:hypothetical protein [Symploca sp. SIO2E6]